MDKGRFVITKETPLSSEGNLLIIALFSGGAIIAICQWFSAYGPVQELHFFNLFGFENRRWSIGRRELVHSVGFVGCVLFGWSFARSMTIKLLRKIHVTAALISIAGIYLAANPRNFMGDAVWDFLLSSHGGMKIYCGLVVLGLIAHRWTPRLLGDEESIRLTVISMLVISLGWELICQPIFHTYRAPNRTGLDAAQILCDLVGIGTGLIITRYYQLWVGGKRQQ